MRTAFLPAIIFLFAFHASAQRKVGLKNKDTWNVILLNDSTLTVEGESILLDVSDTWMDSCSYYNNELEIAFQLVNSTDRIIIVNSRFEAWNDSGLASMEYLRDPVEIMPGQKKKLFIFYHSYSRTQLNSHRNMLITSPGRTSLITVGLKQKYTSKRCGQN